MININGLSISKSGLILARKKGMKSGVGKKAVILFFIIGQVFAVLGPQAFAAETRKVKILWGEAISYELTTVKSGRVSYDGSAYVARDEKGGPANKVVINTVFFEKEAGELWEFFSSGAKPGNSDMSNRSDLASSLIAIEKRITDGTGLSGKEKRDILGQLEWLERELKIAAWHPVYRKVVTEKGNSATARRYFTEMFSEIRKSTIEIHELSHLLDERRVGDRTWADWADPEKRRFVRDSEIRAFITELAYGCNPRDTLWQAVSGVKDEVSRGRDVDASLSKFADVLRAAEKTGILDVRGIVACLCTLSNEQSRMIALRLYEDYRLTASRMIPVA